MLCSVLTDKQNESLRRRFGCINTVLSHSTDDWAHKVNVKDRISVYKVEHHRNGKKSKATNARHGGKEWHVSHRRLTDLQKKSGYKIVFADEPGESRVWRYSPPRALWPGLHVIRGTGSSDRPKNEHIGRTSFIF